jgi:hypothetical protein
MQQSARENERQMGGRRQRLHIERQQCNKNGATRANATTSQGKQEGSAKASVTRWWVDEGKVRARLTQRRLEVGGRAMRQDFEEKYLEKLANHAPPRLAYFHMPLPKIVILVYSHHNFPVQIRPYFCC